MPVRVFNVFCMIMKLECVVVRCRRLPGDSPGAASQKMTYLHLHGLNTNQATEQSVSVVNEAATYTVKLSYSLNVW